jgi:glycosyltransferase 2 family protein
VKGGHPMLKWLAGACSVAILLVIYTRIDMHALLDRLAHAHPLYFALAIACFVPQILVTALRWKIMMADIRPMKLLESIQMVMAGKALNALVPSKLGEMSKAYFLKRGGELDTGKSVSAVILEKVLDLSGLCAVLLLGVLSAPSLTEPVLFGAVVSGGVLAAAAFVLLFPIGGLGRRLMDGGGVRRRAGQLVVGWGEVLSIWRSQRGRVPGIVALSALLWGLHVLQIYLFFPSLNQWVPVAPALAYIPLGILAGLLPITMGGMGTRDTALILLFAPYADAPVMAGVGLLCSMRYWADTLIGVPFFHHYTRRLSPAGPLGAAPKE